MAKRSRSTENGEDLPSAKYQRVEGLSTRTLDDSSDTQNVKFESALGFLEQVKRQLAAEPHTYKEFLRIMKELKGQEIDTKQVVEQVAKLFRNHPNLIEAFGHFLPQGQPVNQSVSSGSGNSIGSTSPLPQENNSSFSNTPIRDRSNNENTNKETDLERAKKFILKVKFRFAENLNVYREFIKILKMYQKNEYPLKEVFCKLTNLFQDHTDLLLEFPTFLPSTKQQTHKSFSSQPVAHVKDYTFFEVAKLQLRNEPKLYQEFLKCLLLVNKRIISPNELLLLADDLFIDHPDIYEAFENLCSFDNLDLAPMRKYNREDGIFDRTEIDYSTCKRLGPSYRLLPDEFVHPPSSGRTQFCNEVLNDIWVSLPTGSEEGANFKSSRKNTYEENLFKCEDDRYELDMIIEQNFSTLTFLNDLAIRMSNFSNEELTNFSIEEILDVLHLRAIERIYGDKGKEILSSMYENPAVAVPLVIKRLQQKDEEWRQSKIECNKAWKIIHEKNHYKALDHQSTTFKHRDRKQLVLRNFLVEIKKEKYEKKIADIDEEHLSYTIPNGQVLIDVLNVLKPILQEKATNDEMELFINDFLLDFTLQTTPPGITHKILYGGDEFLVFIRLLETVCSRISKILEMSCETIRLRTPASSLVAPTNAKPPAAAKFSTAQELYKYYFDDLLKPLLESELDQGRYEDECRQLFGKDSYLLFTIDKVLKEIAEQAKIITEENDCLRLLAVYYFETNRALNDFDNIIYRTNACDILHKYNCFRFICSKNIDDSYNLSICLLDDYKEKNSIGLTTKRSEYKQYLSKYLNTSISTVELKKLPFLQRNRRLVQKKKTWNQNLEIDNRLECKLCMTTLRMFYVQDTADYFYRKKNNDNRSKNGTTINDKRMMRLKKWDDTIVNKLQL